MGQKVNPHGLRVGVIKDWDSRWFANKATFRRYSWLKITTFGNYIKKNLYAQVFQEWKSKDSVKIR